MTPDPIAEIVAYLLADTAVQAIAGERVFGELPRDVNASMPVAAVVVTPAGGPGRPGVTKIRRTRVDTTCYGATVNAAWKLHLAVREALETLERREGALISIEITSDGSAARDPVTQWPTCYASYSVLSDTETAAP